MDMKIVKKIIFLVALMSVCFACSKKEIVVENDVEINDETEMTNIEETTVEKTVEETVVETVASIDVSDIEDPDERSFLLRMDNINQIFGKDMAITREEYYASKNVKVSIIGDSIADCSKSSLIKYFNNPIINAEPGREINKLWTEYHDMMNRRRLADVVIVSLGTNAIEGIETELLEKVYENLEGRPMILLTVVIPYTGQERNRNRDILKFIETHENCHLADWHKTVKERPEYFVEDLIHPNGAGGEVYAHLLLKTVLSVLK